MGIWFFICINLRVFFLRIFWVKFGLICFSGFGEDDKMLKVYDNNINDDDK